MDSTNEPVAWLIQAKTWHEFTFDKPSEDNENEAIEVEPLYTHPVKELTDAETVLRSLYEAIIRYENLSLFPDKYAIESCEYQLHDAKEKARAILRKTQEK